MFELFGKYSENISKVTNWACATCNEILSILCQLLYSSRHQIISALHVPSKCDVQQN